jgi:hypothetical protein
MDDDYIEAVAKLLAAEAVTKPRCCEHCGGRNVIIAAVPLDPSLGEACLPVVYCRDCDAEAPEAAEMFAAFDEVRERGHEPPGGRQD